MAMEEYLYHVDTEPEKREIACLEMDTPEYHCPEPDTRGRKYRRPFKKAIEHDIHKAVNAYKQVFSCRWKSA